jgi:NitT/TauT family transport system substrate-binding protein
MLKGALNVRSWCLVLAFFLASVVLTAPSKAAELTKVSIRMDWVLNGYHSPFFVGVTNGYYREEGLDVTVQPGNGSGVVAQAVANGNGTFGFVDGGTMMNLISKGLEVRAVMGILQQSPLAVVYNTTRGIAEPKDLEGKKVGVTNGEAPLILLPAFFKAAHVDSSKVNLVNASAATKEAIMVSGQVDAETEFNFVGIPPLEAQGMKVGAFKFADSGVNVPGNCIIAPTSFIASNPDVVRRFVRATQKAYQWTLAHPSEAIDILIADSPNDKIVKPIALRVLNLSLELLHSKATENLPIGVMSPEDWKHGEDLLVEYQGITKLGDPSRYMTDAFLETK